MTRPTVTVKVPPHAGHLSILRTTVGGFAARQDLTLEQVDDLRMAVEEAAVQLLRQAHDERITMDVTGTEEGVEVRLYARVAADAAVIEESSWSWMILQALADDIKVERAGGRWSLTLTKRRHAESYDGTRV